MKSGRGVVSDGGKDLVKAREGGEGGKDTT